MENFLINYDDSEVARKKRLLDIFRRSPVFDEEIVFNLGLFINRQNLTRILFMHELYQKAIETHGVVMEFGCRWGQNLSLFSSFRGIYEPYNHSRTIIGFDSFSGFPSVDEKDGKHKIIKESSFNVADNYEEYLEELLAYHESESPLSHIKKFNLVKGDILETLPEYLAKNQHTIISLVYIDVDIYAPTKKILECIKPYLTKGSIIGFDEMNHHAYPGETLAFNEVFGLGNYSVKRTNLTPHGSYIVFE